MVRNKVAEESEGQAARQRLLQAALDLFTERGYASSSVREIVDAAGLTKPMLYYYFKNKEGIYLELFREPFALFSKILEDARHEEGGVRERVVRLFDRIFALFVARLKVARLMYSIYYGPPQGAPFFDFEGFHLKMQEVTGLIVRQGTEKGEIMVADVDAATWVLLGALNFVMEEQLCHRSPMIDRNGLARILDLIFEGLTDKSPGRSRKGSDQGGRRGTAVHAGKDQRCKGRAASGDRRPDYTEARFQCHACYLSRCKEISLAPGETTAQHASTFSGRWGC